MKRFMYLSVSLMCLAISVLIGFHLGSRSAEAQAHPVIGYSMEGGIAHWVILDNGDLYEQILESSPDGSVVANPPRFAGNFFDGALPTAPSTWGNVKGKYDGDK